MSDQNPKLEVLRVGDVEGAIAYTTGQPRKSGPATTQEPQKAPEATSAATAATPPPGDDEEDEIGLTAAERAALLGASKDDLPQGVKKAIGKKHRIAKEWEERSISHHAEALAEKQRADALERELAEIKAKQAPPAEPAKAPASDKFRPFVQGEDVDRYWEERDEWNRQRFIKKFHEEEAERQAKEARAEQGRQAETLITEAKKLVPDFAEITSKADLHFGDDVSEAIWQSERFPEIAYHLAKNPDLAASIRKMNIGKALLAVGRLEATLAPFASTAKAAPSTAPVPPAPPPSAPPTAPAPSQTRDVPVITPLAESSEAQVSSGRPTTAQAVEAFQQKTGRDLYKRRRN